MASPKIMKEVFIFDKNQNNDLRSGTHVVTRNMYTEHFETRHCN